MAKAAMYFPDDFLWGTATSAHQVEGNNKNNDWWVWEQEGHIVEGERSGIACNWWESAEDDLDQAAEMGTTALRLSLEWSRIEPEPGIYDEEAILRYRQILQAAVDRGMDPMVTLHHFTNPLWLTEMGDFNSDVVVDYFGRYSAKVASSLGDLFQKWITINEPMVYFIFRYLAKTFPEPTEKGWSGGMQAIRNMLRCHAAAYHAIKDKNPQAAVGVAKNYILMEPRPNGGIFDQWWARRVHRFLNDGWMESMATGQLRWPIGRGKIAHLAGTFDFVGINYYSRFFAPFPPRPKNYFTTERSPGALLVDGGFYEVYPEGLFTAIKDSLRFSKPIFITENGLPDAADQLRSRHILGHLREIWRAISFNFPVMGYYHWTLTDNFEWDHGWSQRFGLIELDPQSQERTWRTSAHLYQEICQQNRISSDMALRYAPELMESMFPGQPPD
jgi:beta-glucosidase